MTHAFRFLYIPSKIQSQYFFNAKLYPPLPIAEQRTGVWTRAHRFIQLLLGQGSAEDIGVMEINLNDAVKFNWGFQGALQGAGTPNEAGAGAFVPIVIGDDNVFFLDALLTPTLLITRVTPASSIPK